jgi:hypothetical protein
MTYNNVLNAESMILSSQLKVPQQAKLMKGGKTRDPNQITAAVNAHGHLKKIESFRPKSSGLKDERKNRS